MNRSPGMDIVRVAAIGLVMVAHGTFLAIDAHPELRYLSFAFGSLGVEIFFVLSGFLIGHQLLDVSEKTQSVGAFWARRWLRTLPCYYLFLLVNAAIYPALGREGEASTAYLLFAQNLVQPFQGAFFGESWSLAVEEWFYLLAPLFIVCAARVPYCKRDPVIASMLVLITASNVARFALAWQSEMPIDSGLRKVVAIRLDALAWGVLLAWLSVNRRHAFAALSNHAWVGFVLAGCCCGAIAWWTTDMRIMRAPSGFDRILAPLVFAALPFALAILVAWFHEKNWPARTWILHHSRIAYSMYLLHIPLVLVMLAANGSYGKWWTFVPAFVIWYGATAFLATIVYWYYEKPIMDLRERFVPRPPRAESKGAYG
ncbi:MAG: acyltransferase [Betaproteobacteria bacterium]|nr:acyltransferase [Betaproteobacteria bacterium]